MRFFLLWCEEWTPGSACQLASVCLLSPYAHLGRLPVRAGLGARDTAPRPGGEGPQGARSHQLAAPPARRQARTADILPLCMCPVLWPLRPPGHLVFFPLCFVSGVLVASASKPSHVTRRHVAQLLCCRAVSGLQVSRTNR